MNILPGVLCVGAACDEGRRLIQAAAPQHAQDVRDVLIDHLSPTQMDMLIELGALVETRLAHLAEQP
ncbi:hypothetical protein AB0G87_00010 [Streptomyces asoensis]|uniref:hypothetical protein n=1 Tax=Streptomyces asoensis TaxID=249586 RepID=UPI0033ED2B8C